SNEHALISGGPNHATEIVDLMDFLHAMSVDAAGTLPSAALDEALRRAFEFGVQLLESKGFDSVDWHHERFCITVVITIHQRPDLDQLGAPAVAHEHRGVAGHAGADTDEHLHEIGPAHREERHAGLAGDCLGEQRLARARWSEQQRTLGNAPAQALEF